MANDKPHRVFLSFEYVRKRAPSIGYLYIRARWISRGSGVVMYQSKVCGALNGDDARAAAKKLAIAWLERQNTPPRRSENIIAAEEWRGPRYVDTTQTEG